MAVTTITSKSSQKDKDKKTSLYSKLLKHVQSFINELKVLFVKSNLWKLTTLGTQQKRSFFRDWSKIQYEVNFKVVLVGQGI